MSGAQFGQYLQQEVAYLFLSSLAIFFIIRCARVIGTSWIVLACFIAGYVSSFLDDSYVHPNILGGLGWALIASFIVVWWTRRKQKSTSLDD
jgi:hypothetical protein